MGSAPTAPTDGYPTLFIFQIYDLPTYDHSYHHLSGLLVRSVLNLLLMLNWVWIVKFLPVLEQLVCKCGHLIDWLEPILCYWLLNFVMIVLPFRLVCPHLLPIFILRYMVGIITQLYGD